LSRFFARVRRGGVVLADPAGSVLVGYLQTGKIGKAGSWLVEGIGEDFIPPVCDLSRVRKAYSIPDSEAFDVCRTLLKAEGIMAGTSSGTLIAAALRYCREQSGRNASALVPDSGTIWVRRLGMIDQAVEREKRRPAIHRPPRQGARWRPSTPTRP
jgi:cystathionine beta-synthase